METTKGVTLRMTNAAIQKAAKRKITAEDILACVEAAEPVPNEEREGQVRLEWQGLTLVGVEQESVFLIVTLYKEN